MAMLRSRHGSTLGALAAPLTTALTTAMTLLGGCAHTPAVVLPVAPPRSVCDDVGSNEARARFASDRYVVAVGQGASADPADPESDARNRAEASATARVVSQLLVKVQSDLSIRERESSTGASYDATRRTRTQVERVQVPGLRIVDSCYDPRTGTAAAFAALDRVEAAAALAQTQAAESRALDDEAERLLTDENEGRLLSALLRSTSLGGRLEQWRRQEALSAALGNPPSVSAGVTALNSRRDQLAGRRLARVVRKGVASEPAFEPLASNIAGAVGGAGWKLAGSGAVPLIIVISVDACTQQPIPMLEATRTRCALSVALVDAATGAALRTVPLASLEGVGASRTAALGEAVRKAAAPLARSVREAIDSLGVAP